MQAKRPPLTGEYLCRHVDDQHRPFAQVCANLGLNEVIGRRLLEAGRAARRAGKAFAEQQKEAEREAKAKR